MTLFAFIPKFTWLVLTMYSILILCNYVVQLQPLDGIKQTFRKLGTMYDKQNPFLVRKLNILVEASLYLN